MHMKEYAQIDQALSMAENIVIIQADNPDGDSLASALALENIIGEMKKNVHLYCGVDIPGYLHYLKGWDRVSKDLPNNFDLSIIVDNSADTLLASLNRSGQKGWLATRPCIVIDHHDVDISIKFASIVCNQQAVATGEIIYELASYNKWSLNAKAKEMIAVSIMSDSLGLISEGTTARSIRIMADLVEGGVSLAKLDSDRRDLMRKSPALLAYKGELLKRLEFHDDNKIVTVTIPFAEIEQYSHAYNPPMLVIDDMRQAEGAKIAIAFKTYPGGKVTAKIRCNYGVAIAGILAEHFGGGGHPYASGFKIEDGRSIEEIKEQTIAKASELIGNKSK